MLNLFIPEAEDNIILVFAKYILLPSRPFWFYFVITQFSLICTVGF